MVVAEKRIFFRECMAVHSLSDFMRKVQWQPNWSLRIRSFSLS